MNKVQSTASSSDSQERRILIVDDDRDFADSLVDILGLKGYEIAVANNEKKAISILKDFNPQVALLDIRLGRGSGIDLLTNLLKARPDLLCMMITAFASIETAIEALQSGAYNYLNKPINSYDLYASLDRCFEKLHLEDEKIKAEKALRESEKRYRQFLHNFQGIAYRSTINLTPIFFHGAVEQISGYGEKEFISGNLSWDQIIYQDDKAAIDESTKKIVSNSLHSEEREYRIRHKDGHLRWVHESIQNICDDSGNLSLIEGAIYDITERMLAEEELRNLRNLISNIIDSMPSMLVAVDKDGIVTQWNRETEKFTGLSADKANGLMLANALPGFSKEIGKFRQAIHNRELLKDEKIAHKINDEERYFNITFYPLVTNGIEGAVVRIDDVTERVHMEEIMIQSEKMLSVGGLAAGMAHEINNPLAGILQNAQVLQKRLSEEIPANIRAAEETGLNLKNLRSYMEHREIFRMIENIISSGRRAALIVNDMLSFSRKSEMKFIPVDLRKLLKKTVEMVLKDYDMKKQYNFHKTKIIHEFKAEMPDVLCDENKLLQVFLNILKNSAQAMGEYNYDKKEKPQLNLRVFPKDNMACIEIEDNGPGMTEQVRKRVFEPFFTTKGIGSGTGLGLSVSYFIISENHGGTMSVESMPDMGTKFIIRLPIERSLQ